MSAQVTTTKTVKISGSGLTLGELRNLVAEATDAPDTARLHINKVSGDWYGPDTATISVSY